MRLSEVERKRRLVEEHLGFVRGIAAKVRESLPSEIEYGDLVAYGTQGLLEAADRFDKTQGVAFTTFAYYRVRGAIFDGLRRMGWLPRAEYARYRFEERASNYLGNLAGAAERKNDASTTNVEDDVRALASALSGVAAIFVASMTAEQEDTVADPAASHEDYEKRQAQDTVREVVSSLPDKERRLIQLYYFEEKTMEEIGTLLGLSKSWTSRLHARAVDLMQAGMALKDPNAELPVVRKRVRANARK